MYVVCAYLHVRRPSDDKSKACLGEKEETPACNLAVSHRASTEHTVDTRSMLSFHSIEDKYLLTVGQK